MTDSRSLSRCVGPAPSLAASCCWPRDYGVLLSILMVKAPKGSLLSAVEFVTGVMMQIRPSPLRSTVPPVSGGDNDAETSCHPVGQPGFVSHAAAGLPAARADGHASGMPDRSDAT